MAKIFNNEFFKIRNFKLSDIEQGIPAIQMKEEFLPFKKKNFSEKEKNPILEYPGVRYTHKKLNFALKLFFEKCLFEYKFDSRLKKNTKKYFRANLKITWKIFLLSPSKKFFSFIYYDTSNFMPKQEKISSKIRSKTYEICMTSIFYGLSLWNCMISIFGLWRLTWPVHSLASYRQFCLPSYRQKKKKDPKLGKHF